jgi:acyl carrier protein
MTQTEVENYVFSYFADKIANGDLSATFKDLDIDSLNLVEFVMNLEEKFDVEINADEIDENGSIGQFCAIVERALKAKQRN